MSLIVETGSVVPGAESYQSVAQWKAWADARGVDRSGFDDARIEQSLRRGTAYIDGAYRARFAGLKVGLRTQSLEWPRYGVLDYQGFYVASDTIPVEIAAATNEAAARDLASTGSLSPDIKPGSGIVRRVKAGPVEVEFSSNGQAFKIFPVIDDILSALLGVYSPFTGSAARG